MSKEKFKMKDACKKGTHEWMVTRWYVKGNQKNATEVSCKFCLMIVETQERQLQASVALGVAPEKA